jgi:hypothetical protein
MAGKKGRSGRKPRAKTIKHAAGTVAANTPAQSGPSPSSPSAPIEVGPSNTTDFEAAVRGVLESESPGSPFPPGNGSPGQQGSTNPPGSPTATEVEEDSFVGIDAWKTLIEAPFKTAAMWLGVPALADLGRLRAKMIADPSYPLYRHWVKEYLKANPDDAMFICKTMTLGVLATVLQEAWIICRVQWAANKVAAESGGAIKDIVVEMPPAGPGPLHTNS